MMQKDPEGPSALLSRDGNPAPKSIEQASPATITPLRQPLSRASMMTTRSALTPSRGVERTPAFTRATRTKGAAHDRFA